MQAKAKSAEVYSRRDRVICQAPHPTHLELGAAALSVSLVWPDSSRRGGLQLRAALTPVLCQLAIVLKLHEVLISATSGYDRSMSSLPL
jgi:hypothetical protein